MNHNFNFKGGEKLSKISASWLVSYLYYLHIDKNHLNWEKDGYTKNSVNSRKSLTNNTKEFHLFWVNEVLNMNDNKLTNGSKLKLTSIDVKNMARDLLSFYSKTNL